MGDDTIDAEVVGLKYASISRAQLEHLLYAVNNGEQVMLNLDPAWVIEVRSRELPEGAPDVGPRLQVNEFFPAEHFPLEPDGKGGMRRVSSKEDADGRAAGG